MKPPAPPVPCARCPLRSSDAFAPANAEEVGFIQQFREGMVDVAATQEILREHDTSPWLYTLFAGWAFRFKTLADGRRQILNFLLPGDFIGLQEQFADGASHGVEALTDTRLCRFPKDGLWGLYREYPSLGYDITWLSAREENIVDEILLSVGRRSAAERIAMLLIHLYRRAERLKLGDDAGVPFPVSQQHVADALGLSLVHTNKTLRRLQKLGLHQIANGRLRLLNPHALERLADYADRPLRRIPLL
jgi:CRP-like cAMP-binding protein